jgi:Tfp pilus assembly pilus retraction ATPase PilT
MIQDYKKFLGELMDIVEKEGASDLHISENRKPTVRVSGYLVPLVKMNVFTKADTEGLLGALVDANNKKAFHENKELDFSYMHTSGN